MTCQEGKRAIVGGVVRCRTFHERHLIARTQDSEEKDEESEAQTYEEFTSSDQGISFLEEDRLSRGYEQCFAKVGGHKHNRADETMRDLGRAEMILKLNVI